MPRPDTGARAARARRARDPLTQFLGHLADIDRAVTARDWMRMSGLLRKRISSHLPRDVREELLVLSRAPRESYRAPVEFLRFQHRMQQLAVGGGTLPSSQSELPFDAAARPATARTSGEAARVRVAALKSAEQEERLRQGSVAPHVK
jgi:hypothetical protein